MDIRVLRRIPVLAENDWMGILETRSSLRSLDQTYNWTSKIELDTLFQDLGLSQDRGRS